MSRLRGRVCIFFAGPAGPRGQICIFPRGQPEGPNMLFGVAGPRVPNIHFSAGPARGGQTCICPRGRPEGSKYVFLVGPAQERQICISFGAK